MHKYEGFKIEIQGYCAKCRQASPQDKGNEPT